MSIEGYYLLPHPPIIIPEIGKGEEQRIVQTTSAFHTVGKDIAQKEPDTVILVTPHGPMFRDAIALCYEDEMAGDMGNFNTPSVSMAFLVNKKLTRRIYELAEEEGLSSVLLTNSLLKNYRTILRLDHGTMVPLYFIHQHYRNFRLVHITYAPFGDIDLYRFGMLIKKAVEELREKAVFIASGDLSHRLKEDGPYGYHPAGPRFDEEFLQHLKNGNVPGVFSLDKEMIGNAGECGRRSVAILLGTLDGKKFEGELLSYEGPFGVGYGIMEFHVVSDDQSMLEKLEVLRSEAYKKKQDQKDPFVRLARESLTTYLNTGRRIEKLPDYVTDEMKGNRRGVFVSLKKFGELRGCIGTIFPTTENVAEEIIRNAIEAGLHDPRFEPVERDELLDIDFSVDVLSEPEPATKEELNPKEYGVIVRSGGRTGLLLPDLEGVDTVEEQLSIALRKAGIRPGEAYTVERFRVIRHREV